MDEQADDIDIKLQLLAEEQDNKMSKSFERIAIGFAQRSDAMGKDLNEYVNNTFAAMATQNELMHKKAVEDLRNELFPRARNRMEIDTATVHNNPTPTPAVTPGTAGSDTMMSECGADE